MQRSQRSQLAHEKNDRRRDSEVPRERSHCGADESVRPRETDKSESPRVRKASTPPTTAAWLSWRHCAFLARRLVGGAAVAQHVQAVGVGIEAAAQRSAAAGSHRDASGAQAARLPWRASTPTAAPREEQAKEPRR